ncbi:MAG: ATP-binding protein [Acidobacteria bacterium]|nr:ATP-binding protein [Acidobacteriota bacterium]
MTTRSRQGPFRPGAGGLPPYLAGRTSVQTLCRALLGDLRDGLAPSRDLVLHGPRGNGKTALLVWLQQEAAAYAGVDVLSLTPAGMPDETKLVERLLPASWWRRFAPGQVSVQGITWRPGRHDPPPLDEALAARVRKAPLLLLIDEAHTLEVAVGRALLNAGQQVGRRLPFLLVLAGTPNLRAHLNAMDATFWNRADRRPIGRLDEPATAAAVRNPLRSDDIDIEDEALAHIVRDSHGYPYFVQLWGQAVWRRAAGATPPSAAPPGAAEERRITLAAATAVQTAVNRDKDDYYLDRYEELETLRLLPVARSVAEAFDTHPLLDDVQLETAIRRGLAAVPEADSTTAKDLLRNVGYVWRPEAKPVWEPGIPSLMDYVREHAPVTRSA